MAVLTGNFSEIGVFLIYGSVCSGIEAATVAWEPLGWKPSFFSEIEAFPRSVLSHHYPTTPLHGDFTTIGENDYEPIDLLVGGTPCQAFSVAGLRKGFSDHRGNLTLEFIRLAQRLRPKWIVWENVPGVLSIDRGRAFGAFLGGLAECGYGFAYRVLDAQHFGVPQRRRRVFVVGCLGESRSAAQVLFEREGLQGDSVKGEQERQEAAENVAKCLTSRGAGCGNLDLETSNVVVVSPTITSNGDAHSGFRDEKGLVVCPINTQMALRGAETSNSSREGIGLGDVGDPSFTLQRSHSHAVAIGWSEELTAHENLAGTIQRGGQGVRHEGVMTPHMQVRRLTPVECERLQGFPDNYTKISDKTADGSRYKALGNSMAVPVMAWIGKRIEMVETTQ